MKSSVVPNDPRGSGIDDDDNDVDDDDVCVRACVRMCASERANAYVHACTYLLPKPRS